MGKVLVSYGPLPSSMLSAGKVEADLYTHLSFDVLKYVGKVGGVDVVEVHAAKEPARLAELRPLFAEVRYVRVPRAWYDDYSMYHLVDSRVRDVREVLKGDDYEALIRAELRSVELLRHVVESTVPRRLGSFTLVATRLPVPTMDLALYYAAKDGAAACATSPRDLGLTLSCAGPEPALRAIDSALRANNLVLSKVGGGLLSGFVVTYPEAPMSYVSALEELLGNVNAEGYRLGGLPKVQERIIGMLSPEVPFEPYTFLRLRARFMAKYAKRTYIKGQEYVVLSCSSNSAFHVALGLGGSCAVKVLMPVDRDVAFLAPYRVGSVSAEDWTVKPEIYEAAGGYLAVVAGSKEVINRDIKKGGASVLILTPEAGAQVAQAPAATKGGAGG